MSPVSPVRRFASRVRALLAIEVRWPTSLLVVRVSLPGTPWSVISWVKRLTKTETADHPGGASGEDPSHERTLRQDLLAALSFLDAVDKDLG